MKKRKLNHQQTKKVAKVPGLAADNPHKEGLIDKNLLSLASLNT